MAHCVDELLRGVSLAISVSLTYLAMNAKVGCGALKSNKTNRETHLHGNCLDGLQVNWHYQPHCFWGGLPTGVQRLSIVDATVMHGEKPAKSTTNHPCHSEIFRFRWSLYTTITQLLVLAPNIKDRSPCSPKDSSPFVENAVKAGKSRPLRPQGSTIRFEAGKQLGHLE